MTFFSTKPVLSIFARCVNAARRHYDYFAIEVTLSILQIDLEMNENCFSSSVVSVFFIYVYVPIIRSFVCVYLIIFIYLFII